MFDEVNTDTYINDLKEENKYLRQELFLLCERIQETEVWRQERPPLKETQFDDQEDSNKQFTSYFREMSKQNKDDIDNKLSVLETEIVQIRLTNFEITQKMQEIERMRLIAVDEARRMQREVQRLVPHASLSVTLRRNLQEIQDKLLRFRLAQQAAQKTWGKIENNHIKLKTDNTAFQKKIQTLTDELKHTKLILQETKQQLELERKKNEDSKVLLHELQIEAKQQHQSRELLLSELRRSQCLCLSQAKELERVQQLQTRTFLGDTQYLNSSQIQPTKPSPQLSMDVCSQEDISPKQITIKHTISQSSHGTKNGQQLSHSRPTKTAKPHQSDSNQCGFFCVPL